MILSCEQLLTTTIFLLVDTIKRILKKYFQAVRHKLNGLTRRRRPDMFYNKGVLKNYVKFAGKHWNLFFNKVAGVRHQLTYDFICLQKCFYVCHEKSQKFSNHHLLGWTQLAFNIAVYPDQNLDSPTIPYCIYAVLYLEFHCKLFFY